MAEALAWDAVVQLSRELTRMEKELDQLDPRMAVVCFGCGGVVTGISLSRDLQ